MKGKRELGLAALLLAQRKAHDWNYNPASGLAERQLFMGVQKRPLESRHALAHARLQHSEHKPSTYTGTSKLTTTYGASQRSQPPFTYPSNRQLQSNREGAFYP